MHEYGYRSGLLMEVLSLGAGVQSSTLALMAARGEIVPKPAFAIFADTQREPASVYQWLDWLEKQLNFPVYRVTAGDLGTVPLKLHRSKLSGKLYHRSLIPVFITKPTGTRGIFPRKCTRDFKLAPIWRELRQRLGLPRNYRHRGTSPLVAQWIGISTDEAHRMKPSPKPWIVNRYPLIEAGMSRADCLAWAERAGLPKPPRSACVFCPYHSDAEWLRLKNEEPAAFAAAVQWERDYQTVVAGDEVVKGVPFLHETCTPLDQVRLNPAPEKTQKNLFGNECEGMCGV